MSRDGERRVLRARHDTRLAISRVTPRIVYPQVGPSPTEKRKRKLDKYLEKKRMIHFRKFIVQYSENN